MIRITQLKLALDHTKEELEHSIIKALKIHKNNLLNYMIIKQSIDARKKNEIKYIYTIDVVLEKEFTKKSWKNSNISVVEDITYEFKITGDEKQKNRPVIIGAGPAGLFCSYMLAKAGYMPILLERGDQVDKRVDVVNHFWKVNNLQEDSNVQFGEGGAGTFSDGKLNTLVKDSSGRNRKVLELFVEYGASEEILYKNKPHIGTDHLREVITNIREAIIGYGGEVHFQSKVYDFVIENKQVVGVKVLEHSASGLIATKKMIPCDTVVVAIGHSARDTFSCIYEKGIEMVQKPFAIGVRIEHPQELINKSQYGESANQLPPAEYKLTYKSKNGRNVYSFCMCPGGFVVNASSEKNRIAVNGMSNHARDENNANSAVIITVSPKDYGSDLPLAGVEFQRKWESLAYQCGKGKVPVQLYGDLCRNQVSTAIGGIVPNIKGDFTLSNLSECLPPYIIQSLIEGIQSFDHKIKGFANEEAVLSGVETRTSSPIRILRDEGFESNMKGFYPCGEGAGYAGGITSAAMDGIKVAEAIAAKYKP